MFCYLVVSIFCNLETTKVLKFPNFFGYMK